MSDGDHENDEDYVMDSDDGGSRGQRTSELRPDLSRGFVSEMWKISSAHPMTGLLRSVRSSFK